MAEEVVLGFLEKNDEISDLGEFASERGIDHQELTNIIKSLHGFRFVDAQDIKRERWVLTEEGRTYAAAGSPEVQVFSAIPLEGISPEELQRKMDPAVFKIGRSQAIKNQWLEMGKQLVTKKVQNVQDNVKDMLTRVQNGEVIDPKEIDALKRRKLIAPQTWKGYSVRKGPNYAPKRKKFATDLTRDNLQRAENVSNFIQADPIFGPDAQLVYKTYATLYFVFIFDSAENELAMLDLMQVFVETLDKCFSNVCELDIVFNFNKVHTILDEIVLGGQVLETSSSEVMKAVEEISKLEKASNTILVVPKSIPGWHAQ